MAILNDLIAVPEEQRNDAWQHAIMVKTRKANYPYSAHFELTPLCSLNCKMCYVHLSKERAEQEGHILTGDEWIALGQECLNAGMYSLTLTGGECMMHPDFMRIYSTLYDMGFAMGIMSNATLVTEEIAEMLQKRPPTRVTITMYGFSEETYERACGNGSAFTRVLKAIDLLQSHHIVVALQSTITIDMIDDVPRIAQYAKEHNIQFIYNHVLKANRECDIDSVEALSAEEVKFVDMEKKICAIRGIEYREPPEVDISKVTTQAIGIRCGAGANAFHINWKGEMTPCVTFDAYRTYPLKVGIAKAWEEMHEWAKTIPQIVECQTCKYQNRCKHCIAIHWGDMHEFGVKSPRLCYKIQHNIKD